MIQQTSFEAFQALENRGEKQMMVYHALEALGEACNLEVARHLNRAINTITPRMNELVKAGLVEEAGKKVNPITNKNVIYWRITEL